MRPEATSEGRKVQIRVAYSGLGLSLCATILRDHQGRASAVNLEPRGGDHSGVEGGVRGTSLA